MPVIKSATKQLRQAQKRYQQNRQVKTNLRSIMAAFHRKPSAKGLARVASTLGKAVKQNIIHKNKASRLTSRLSRLVR